MKVYHASKYTIKSPDVKHSRDLLDFGKGFYLTSLVGNCSVNAVLRTSK